MTESWRLTGNESVPGQHFVATDVNHRPDFCSASSQGFRHFKTKSELHVAAAIQRLNGLRGLILDGDGSAFISETRNRRAIEAVCEKGGFTIDPDTFWDIPSGDNGSGDERVWKMIVNGTDNFDAPGTFSAFPEFLEAYPDENSFQHAVDEEYMNNLDGLEVNQPVLNVTNQALDTGLIVAGASNANNAVFTANLKHTGYPVKHFPAIVGKDDVIAAGRPIKPAGDPFLMVVEQINEQRAQHGQPPLAPEQFAGIEDSRTGALASMNAGLYTFHLSHESGPLDPSEITDPDRYLYISPEDFQRAFEAAHRAPARAAQPTEKLKATM